MDIQDGIRDVIVELLDYDTKLKAGEPTPTARQFAEKVAPLVEWLVTNISGNLEDGRTYDTAEFFDSFSASESRIAIECMITGLCKLTQEFIEDLAMSESPMGQLINAVIQSKLSEGECSGNCECDCEDALDEEDQIVVWDDNVIDAVLEDPPDEIDKFLDDLEGDQDPEKN